MRSPISPPDSALANLQQTMDDLERQLTGRQGRAGRGTHPGDCTAELLQIINSGNRMRRRELFGVVAGAVILLPFASVAQHLDRVSHVGVLMGFAEKETQEYVAAFAKALEGYGWLEGKNLRIDHRFFPATDRTLFDRNAADLVAMSPDVILASTTAALSALHQQTRTILLVFVQVS